MSAEDLCAVLDYLELDDGHAALAFGKTAAEIGEMRAGGRPVDFLISAMTVLMCESPKATQLALEHGVWSRDGEPTFADLLANASGVGFMLKAKRPGLRLVRTPGSKT